MLNPIVERLRAPHPEQSRIDKLSAELLRRSDRLQQLRQPKRQPPTARRGWRRSAPNPHRP